MKVPIRVLLRATLALVSATAVIALGWTLGRSYGRSAVMRGRAQVAAESQQSQAFEAARVDSGEAFPSFQVRSARINRTELEMHDLLPEGGLVVVASAACLPCLSVVDGFRLARSTLEIAECPMVLVLEGGASDAEVALLTDTHGDLQVYTDEAETLVRTYRVVENPSYFFLDDAGTVVHAGFGLRTIEEFAQLMNQYCSPGNR